MMCPPCDRSSRHGKHRAHVCDETKPNNGHGYTCACPCTLVATQPHGDDIAVVLATTAAAHMPVGDDHDGITSCSCGAWQADVEKSWDLDNDWAQYLAHLATAQADAIRGHAIDIPLPEPTGVTP